VTGILFRVEGLTGKLVEIARDLIPGMEKMRVLVDITTPAYSVQRREIEAAAANLAVRISPIDIHSADEISASIQTFVRERASIVVVLASGMFVNARRQIASFALASRLPTVCTFREHVEDGASICARTTVAVPTSWTRY
jgi:putative ABC transport system substrate-binding protein